MRLDQLTEGKLNYTAIFFENGSHMTWNYGFPLQYPEGITPGDPARVKAIGKYEDDQVACWVLEYEGMTTQPNNEKLLHVTTKVENGGKPVMSGQRATEQGFEAIEPFYLDGVWK